MAAKSKVKIAPESQADRIARLKPILARLKREYPEARCSLNYRNAFELLISTILAAQCTDARVNTVTPALFARFPDARAMAKSKLQELEELIRTTGFYKAKAKSLLTAARAIVEQHGGEVPRTMEELVKLRGVGRKTANVVLGNVYGVPGFPVDTHVGRLTRRLGLTRETDPVKVEAEVTRLLPPKEWTLFSHLLIDHGRAICGARNPLCDECFLSRWCPKVGVPR